MAADSLAPYVARPAAAMLLTALDQWVPVFHKEVDWRYGKKGWNKIGIVT